MNIKLEIRLSRLENSRKELLEEIKVIDAKKLTRSPSKGKWSATQVIYHLNKAECQSLIYVGKKMKDVENLKKTGINEWLKNLVLKVGFFLPIKYKAPVNVLGDVPENVNYSDITKQWDETRKQLKALVSSMPEELLSKNVFKQPVVGRINIYQMLDFMQVHFNRHRKQIERAIHLP